MNGWMNTRRYVDELERGRSERVKGKKEEGREGLNHSERRKVGIESIFH